MAVQIQMRRDVAADWTSANPVLAEGELGLETDTAKWKIGDGATAWTSLGYVNQVVAGPASVSNSGASPALTITNTGSGYSLLVEDSASTDSTPFVVTAAGDVGIGTASPAVKLDVVGVVAVPLGSAALPSITPTGDPNTGIWSPAADTLAVSTGGTERLRVDSTGNVGVTGGLTTSADIGAANVSAVNGALYSDDGTTTARIIASGGASYWGNTTNHAVVIQTNNAERMRIDNDGSVGIGIADMGGLKFVVSDGGTVNTAINPSGGVSYFGTTSNHPLALIANNTERMRIGSDGLITGTGTSLGAWTAYTPTVWSASGTPTTTSSSARYCVIGKTCHLVFSLTVTNKGTATGYGLVTLPFNSANSGLMYTGSGREVNATGDQVQVFIDPNGTTLAMTYPNNASPWIDGHSYRVSVTYEIA